MQSHTYIYSHTVTYGRTEAYTHSIATLRLTGGCILAVWHKTWTIQMMLSLWVCVVHIEHKYCTSYFWYMYTLSLLQVTVCLCTMEPINSLFSPLCFFLFLYFHINFKVHTPGINSTNWMWFCAALKCLS